MDLVSKNYDLWCSDIFDSETVSNLKESADNSTKIQIEFLEGFSRLQKTEREITINFLKKIE